MLDLDVARTESSLQDRDACMWLPLAWPVLHNLDLHHGRLAALASAAPSRRKSAAHGHPPKQTGRAAWVAHLYDTAFLLVTSTCPLH